MTGNAIKFTEKGYVEVSVTHDLDCGNLNEGKMRYLFSVTDSGCGIAKDFLPKLFTPFTQEDASSRRKYEGAGLGLSIVKGMLGLYGSRLEINTDCGRGSTFSFTLEMELDSEKNLPGLPLTADLRSLTKDDREFILEKFHSKSIAVLEARNHRMFDHIIRYLKDWEIKSQLLQGPVNLSFASDILKTAPDIIIINDNFENLVDFVQLFPAFYQSDQSNDSNELSWKNRPRIIYLSSMTSYRKVEAFVKLYRPLSVAIVEMVIFRWWWWWW